MKLLLKTIEQSNLVDFSKTKTYIDHNLFENNDTFDTCANNLSRNSSISSSSVSSIGSTSFDEGETLRIGGIGGGGSTSDVDVEQHTISSGDFVRFGGVIPGGDTCSSQLIWSIKNSLRVNAFETYHYRKRYPC